MYLIEQANRFQPAILAVRERLAIGDPLAKEAVDIEAVDAVLERIWSALGEKHRDSRVPYSPPYQNWLPILLPAMQLLDPGEKPDETYTHFEPPFTIVEAPRPTQHSPEKLLKGQMISQSLSNIRQKIYEEEYYNNEY